MKQKKLPALLTAGAVSAIALSTAFAQTAPTITTIDPAKAVARTSSISTNAISREGTITAYTPGSDSISLRTETSSEPVKYYLTKATTIVDPEGKTVESSMLKPDMPVKYTCAKEGDRMVITTITLMKSVSSNEKTTTTATTKP